MVETIHSFKLADGLQAAWSKLDPASKIHGENLKVMIQVNTSGEIGKHYYFVKICLNFLIK